MKNAKMKLCLIMVVLLTGCSHVLLDSRYDENTYIAVENAVADFSGKIRSYYVRRHFDIPKDFNEASYMVILNTIYPDHRLGFLRKNFSTKVRSNGKYFSVLVCEPGKGKLLEDISCTPQIDIRFWNIKGEILCEFEENWHNYCDSLAENPKF